MANLVLCYTDALGGAPVLEGDIIPAAQTECGRPVTILDWSNRGSRMIKCKISHLKRIRFLIAKELGLMWKEIS